MKDITELPDAHLRVFDRPAPPAPDALKDVYLIGICGTGMGSLAGLLKQAGYHVRGADKAAYPPMSTRLAEMDIPLYEGYDPQHLDPAPDLVVVGNACAPTHPEAAYAREHGLVQLSMPEALVHFFIEQRRSLVVAGTHGKTTTTGMLVHVLRHAGLDPSFLVGGVMQGVNQNYHVGEGPHFVIEGDEYDSAYFDKRPKFLHYRPQSAIVTSMEFDHADIYDTWEDYREAFRAFCNTVPEDGLLVLNGDDPEVRALSDHTEAARIRFFGLSGGDDDVTAQDVETVLDGQHFTLVAHGEELARIHLPMSGRHNLLDALAVCAVALDEGVAPEGIAEAFGSFGGMKRRQEVLADAAGVLVVDDFAHHPTAVQETVRAVAERWPERRVVAVFEPRSNSSRRKVFESAYAGAFDRAGAAFLSSPPFRHNDDPADFMDAGRVAARITERGTPAQAYTSTDDLLADLLAELREGDTALIMSNGGFDGLPRRLVEALKARTRVGA